MGRTRNEQWVSDKTTTILSRVSTENIQSCNDGWTRRSEKLYVSEFSVIFSLFGIRAGGPQEISVLDEEGKAALHLKVVLDHCLCSVCVCVCLRVF